MSLRLRCCRPTGGRPLLLLLLCAHLLRSGVRPPWFHFLALALVAPRFPFRALRLLPPHHRTTRCRRSLWLCGGVAGALRVRSPLPQFPGRADGISPATPTASMSRLRNSVRALARATRLTVLGSGTALGILTRRPVPFSLDAGQERRCRRRARSRVAGGPEPSVLPRRNCTKSGKPRDRATEFRGISGAVASAVDGLPEVVSSASTVAA